MGVGAKRAIGLYRSCAPRQRGARKSRRGLYDGARWRCGRCLFSERSRGSPSLPAPAAGSEPVSLLDGWEGKARDVSFGGRSLPALTPEFPSALGFPVRLPAEPFLDFSIAVEAPEDIARGRVRFRIDLEDGADDYTVFEDVVRARRGNRWRHRSVNLAAWRGREVRLTLEARPDAPGAVGAWAERHPGRLGRSGAR